MQKVRIQKQKLIEVLTKNRAEHHEIFAEAQGKYQTMLIALLQAQLVRAEQRLDVDMEAFIALLRPEDHTEDYNRVLEMLQLSVDDVVELTAHEFQNFVQDNWDWSMRWALSNSRYSDSPKLKAMTSRR